MVEMNFLPSDALPQRTLSAECCMLSVVWITKGKGKGSLRSRLHHEIDTKILRGAFFR